MLKIHGKIQNTFLIKLQDFDFPSTEVQNLHNHSFSLIKNDGENSTVKVWICPEYENYRTIKLHQIQVEIPNTYLDFFNK